MKIAVISDLHLDLYHNDKVSYSLGDAICDVLVIAGDLNSPKTESYRTLLRIRDQVKIPIVFVMGNHEFYGDFLKLSNTDLEIISLMRDEGIYILHPRDTVIINDHLFIGATLWTDFNFYRTPDLSKILVSKGIKDYLRIYQKTGETSFIPITPDHTIVEHNKDVDFIKKNLEENLNSETPLKTIVVTHHLPSSVCIEDSFTGDPMNPAFVSDLDHIIDRYSPNLWIHGHTHISVNKKHMDTRIICNPRGYPRRGGTSENKEFDSQFVVDTENL